MHIDGRGVRCTPEEASPGQESWRRPNIWIPDGANVPIRRKVEEVMSDLQRCPTCNGLVLSLSRHEIDSWFVDQPTLGLTAEPPPERKLDGTPTTEFDISRWLESELLRPVAFGYVSYPLVPLSSLLPPPEADPTAVEPSDFSICFCDTATDGKSSDGAER